MTAAPRKDAVAMEAEVREKIHLEILKRTGAYHSNDHILLPSGQHTTEYIEKTLVTTEPSFTEGLGAVIVYGMKGMTGGKRRVTLPVEFQRLIRESTKVLLIEDLVSTGSTLELLIDLVEQLGAQVVGVGCLWRRTSVELNGKPVFSLVSRDFPTYTQEDCPLCRRGVPLNEEFVR